MARDLDLVLIVLYDMAGLQVFMGSFDFCLILGCLRFTSYSLLRFGQWKGLRKNPV